MNDFSDDIEQHDATQHGVIRHGDGPNSAGPGVSRSAVHDVDVWSAAPELIVDSLFETAGRHFKLLRANQGWVGINLVKTGERAPVTYTVGHRRITVEQDIRRPYVVAHGRDLAMIAVALETSITTRTSGGLYDLGEEITLDESPSDEYVTCHHCGGALVFGAVSCVCFDESGVPDTRCSRCGGTGSFDSPCPVCDGTGTIVARAMLTAVNDETGQSASIVLTSGNVVVRMREHDVKNLLENTAAQPQWRATIDMSATFCRLAKAVGGEEAEHFLFRGRKAVSWTSESMPIVVATYTDGAVSGAQLTRDVERALQNVYSWRGDVVSRSDDPGGRSVNVQAWQDFGIRLDSQGRALERVLRFRPRRNTEELLDDVYSLVSGRGYAYCLTLSPTTSGEPCYQVLLCDPSGEQVYAELASGVELAVALQGAWDEAPGVMNRCAGETGFAGMF